MKRKVAKTSKPRRKLYELIITIREIPLRRSDLRKCEALARQMNRAKARPER